MSNSCCCPHSLLEPLAISSRSWHHLLDLWCQTIIWGPQRVYKINRFTRAIYDNPSFPFIIMCHHYPYYCNVIRHIPRFYQNHVPSSITSHLPVKPRYLAPRIILNGWTTCFWALRGSTCPPKINFLRGPGKYFMKRIIRSFSKR